MRAQSRPASLLLFLSAVSFATVFALGPVSAQAQQPSPLSGLPPAVHTIASAIDSGDPSEIVAHLHPETVVATHYPGHGEERPQSEAEARIPELIVSNAAASDAMGAGSYRLIAVWIPDAMDPAVSLVGSGIGSDGQRATTIFGLDETPSGWRISSYGTVGAFEGMPEGEASTMAFLDFLKTQGDYREVSVPLAPYPPSTGTGLATSHEASQTWHLPAMLALATAIVVAGGIYTRSRSGR